MAFLSHESLKLLVIAIRYRNESTSNRYGVLKNIRLQWWAEEGGGVVELFWKGAEKVTNVRDFAIKDTQRSFWPSGYVSKGVIKSVIFDFTWIWYEPCKSMHLCYL